jgi:putative polyhydroxyalkanoate system protein
MPPEAAGISSRAHRVEPDPQPHRLLPSALCTYAAEPADAFVRINVEADVATITVNKRHNLSHKKAKAVAEQLANDLEKRFDLAWNWEGDHVHFQRPGVSGSMHVGTTDIRLDVKLGFLLTPLKPAIEREIHAQLDKLAKPGKASA